jgi:hypothetical protein
MKLPLTLIILALALTGRVSAAAQSNGVPGPTNYVAFSRFITDRNIFDPNRQPHSYNPSQRTVSRPRTHSTSAPAFTLVGTMSYEKGLFAFFSGNDSDLKKVLPVAQKIAGYTVTEIAPGRAKLESADKKQKLELRVGDVMRQENGVWQLSGSGEIPAGASATETASPAGSNTPATAANTASGPAAEPNDVLKRLMQLRQMQLQKESK